MFEFDEASLPEGVDKAVLAVLNSEPVQALIKSKFDNSFEIQASGLKKTNAELKAEKQRIKELYDGIDVNEYKQLKDAYKSKGKEAEQIERLNAELEAIRANKDLEVNTAKKTADDFKAALEREQLKTFINDSIAQYNAKYQLKVRPGAEKYLIDEAMKAFSRGEKGEFVPTEGERILTGKDGIMSGLEWVDAMRLKESLLYESPVGSGATGSRGIGAAAFDPKQLAGTPAEREKAIAAKFNL